MARFSEHNAWEEKTMQERVARLEKQHKTQGDPNKPLIGKRTPAKAPAKKAPAKKSGKK